MASCLNCATPLEAADKFCRSCGTRVLGYATPPPSKLVGGGTQLIAQSGPAAATPPDVSKTDPFAQTVLGNSLDSVPPPPTVQPSVSPMASSVMATPGIIQAANSAVRSSPPAAPRPPPVHRTPPPPAPLFSPGSPVLVRFSDGNSYTGTVKQTNGPHVLVVFVNGAEHWVDRQYVSPA
jgi:hypothetical protein